MPTQSPLTPPHDLEAEQAVLGSCLLRPQVFDEIAGYLTQHDFYRTAHGEIYQAILTLWDKKEPLDSVTVVTQLRMQGKLEQVGGPVFISSLSEHVGTAAHAMHYAKKVKDFSRLRKFISSCQEVIAAGFSHVDDVDQFIDQSEAKLFEGLEKPKQEMRHLGDILIEAITQTERLFESEGLIGLTSGFVDLDALTGGWQPGDLIILAARPAMGKTACATNFALNANVPVGFFSLEMSCPQLARRIIASECMIDGSRLRTGRLKTDEWQKLHGIAPDIEKPIYLNDNASLTPTELRAQARRLAMRVPLGLIVVDYLQLMNAKAKSREQEVSIISRSLKALAKELNVPVIVLSQLNRDVEKRTNRRPILSDLRDSGSIEQDGDVVMFLYRDEIYRPNSDAKGTAEVHIAKQRNGPTQTIKLAFMPKYFKFADLAKE